MAPRPVRAKKSNLKTARANIRGYTARQARKAASGNSLDVYEYTANRVRRAGVPLSLDRDEEAGLGKDDDGDDELDAVKQRLRRQIANGDEDGVVLSDEDEDIESDDAFEDESDEERFANFKFRESPSKSSRAKGRAAGGERPREAAVSFAVDVDLDEDDGEQEGGSTPRPAMAGSQSDSEGDEAEEEGDDEEDDEDEPGTMIDLSKMLDQGAESESESELESVSTAESEAPSVASSDPDASSKLATFISGLDTSPKKRNLEDAAAERATKKRMLAQDRTEAGPEG
ncbi:hypothetical protein FRC12_008005, partial [Ceratobasidium sp. 428]